MGSSSPSKYAHIHHPIGTCTIRPFLSRFLSPFFTGRNRRADTHSPWPARLSSVTMLYTKTCMPGTRGGIESGCTAYKSPSSSRFCSRSAARRCLSVKPGCATNSTGLISSAIGRNDTSLGLVMNAVASSVNSEGSASGITK